MASTVTAPLSSAPPPVAAPAAAGTAPPAAGPSTPATPASTRENIDAAQALQVNTAQFLREHTVSTNITASDSGHAGVYVYRHEGAKEGKGLTSGADAPLFKLASRNARPGAATIPAADAVVVHVQSGKQTAEGKVSDFTMQPLDSGKLVVTTQLSGCSMVFATFEEAGRKIQVCAHIQPGQGAGMGAQLHDNLNSGTWKITKEGDGKIRARAVEEGTPGSCKLGVWGQRDLAPLCYSTVVGTRSDERNPFQFFSQDVGSHDHPKGVNTVTDVREINTQHRQSWSEYFRSWLPW